MVASVASESISQCIPPQAPASYFSDSILPAGPFTQIIVETVTTYPLISATITLGMCLAGGFITYKYYALDDAIIERLIEDVARCNKAMDRKDVIKNFLVKNWHKLKLPSSCDNQKNRVFLENKLVEITKEPSSQEIALRQVIAKNIIRNFSGFILQAITRIRRDLDHDNELRDLFRIQGHPHIQTVEILGTETHNGGKNPLCIAVVLNHQRIVYKPRSVKPEKLICHTQGSLFQQLGLPTYLVYEKKDQNYGYCQHLSNSEAENTFTGEDTLESLQAFYIEFGKIEKVARAIGLSDLHCDNIIIQNKRPYLIDLEVVALPDVLGVYDTHLFTGSSAGALSTRDTSKNHIWLSREFIERHFNLSEEDSVEELQRELFETGMRNNVLQCSGLLGLITQAIIEQTHPAIVEFDLGNVEAVVAEISDHHNRIALIDTQTLCERLQEDPKEAKELFLKQLIEGLRNWGFQFNKSQQEAVLAKFEEDLRNNDVPIFQHHAKKQKVFYGGSKIGFPSAR